MKTKIFLFCCLFAIGLGCGVGYRYLDDNKTVAIRIGQSQNLLDYDLMSSINFISYHLEKQGYKVSGVSYAGNLYPASLDKAKHNIFVRVFEPFFDVRFKKDTQNTFYVERFVKQYAEEFVGYNNYITSQKSIQQQMSHLAKMHYLPSGAIPHLLLKPDYHNDVLCIYEWLNLEYAEFLKQHIPNFKIYSGAKFARLSDKEREQELATAKLVVYLMEDGIKDDRDFVPFAVYDIISYGRPLLTNFKPSLAHEFNNNIFLFNNLNELILTTVKAVKTPSHIREEHAQIARKILRAKKQDIPHFFN